MKKEILEPNKPIDVVELCQEILGEKIEDYTIPPPSFEIMKCEIIQFDKDAKTITVKTPVLETWLNPYGSMQGGIIMGAVDNAVGPLSLLTAPKNITRNMESKLLKPILMDCEYIYVTATLSEHKKRRLIFDVTIKDIDGNLFATAKVTNWII